MKHKKRSINKAIQRYVLFLHGAMDAALLGRQLYVSKHWTCGRIEPCSIHYLPNDTAKRGVVIWSCATGAQGAPISPEDARLTVRKHFIDRGIPVEALDKVERRG